jgi:hypothetical protein
MARLAVRSMKARRRGVCPDCRGVILPGQRISLTAAAGARWAHTACLLGRPAAAPVRRL